jgi:hypothetical protein
MCSTVFELYNRMRACYATIPIKADSIGIRETHMYIMHLCTEDGAMQQLCSSIPRKSDEIRFNIDLKLRLAQLVLMATAAAFLPTTHSVCVQLRIYWRTAL